MPHPEQEHGLMIEVARLRREVESAARVLGRERARAEAAEANLQRGYDVCCKHLEALAAARRECDVARDAHAYCLHMFPRDWLTDPKNRNIFAAVVFKMLDEALSAPAAAAGEEGT